MRSLPFAVSIVLLWLAISTSSSLRASPSAPPNADSGTPVSPSPQEGKAGEGSDDDAESGQALFVRIPHEYDQVQPFTSKVSLFSDLYSRRLTRLNIPKGTWVAYQSSELDFRILVEYLGAANWQFEIREGREIWLKRDEEEPELVGFATNEDDGIAAHVELRELPTEKVRHSLSVSIRSAEDVAALKTLPDTIPLALSSPGTLDRASVMTLQELNVEALQAFVFSPEVDELSELRNLRMLALGINRTEENESDGMLLTIPDLPLLDHLALMNSAGMIDWPETLRRFPGLVSLVIENKSELSHEDSRPIDSFIDTPRLKVFGIRRGGNLLVEAGALSTALNLQYLHAEDKAIEGYEDIGLLRNLRYLSIMDLRAREELLEDWFASGALTGLMDFRGYYIPDFAYCPRLELIYVSHALNESRFHDFTKFSKAPETLEGFFGVRISSRDLENFDPPHPENLRFLYLYSCRIDDPALVYRFPNLERFSSTSNPGSAREIDLSHFPKLSSLTLSGWSELEVVKGLTGLNQIESVYISGNRYLHDLGESHPNQSIRSVILSGLPALTNLDSLRGLSGCLNLYLRDCHGISSYHEFVRNNPLLQDLNISNCDQLERVLLRGPAIWERDWD